MIDLDDLSRRIRSAQASTEKRGLEMFGYEVREDGTVKAMVRERGVGRVLSEAAERDPPRSTRGPAAQVPPKQGSLL